MRHTFDTWGYLRIKDIRWVQEQLDHKDIPSTQLYTQVNGKVKDKEKILPGFDRWKKEKD
jgi:integrase